MSPCDKIIHVVYITDNTGWYNVLSIIEKHRFCKMIPVESNTSLKSISWIIFLLRSYLFPFYSAFVGAGLVFSTGYHSRMAHGKAPEQIWGVPCVRSVLRGVSMPALQLSWPAPHCRHSSPLLLVQNQEEFWEPSGDIQAGKKKAEKSHLNFPPADSFLNKYCKKFLC